MGREKKKRCVEESEEDWKLFALDFQRHHSTAPV